MQLVIAEKPSVAASIAAALGVKEKKDGYIEGGGYLISWCVGHLVELADAAAYGEQYKKWSYESNVIKLSILDHMIKSPPLAANRQGVDFLFTMFW